MHKLLSLVLSVSIIFGSITPALAQVRGARGIKKVKTSAASLPLSRANLTARISRQVLLQTVHANSPLQARILSGNTAGMAQHILSLPAVQRAESLRGDFVTLSLVPQTLTAGERAAAVDLYKQQLVQAGAALQVRQRDLASFLTAAQKTPAADVVAVHGVLADAAALALVGTREDAPVLLDFAKQAQGTLFEDTAALITARGLLHMQAYGELSEFLAQHPQAVLSGVAAYAKVHRLPVEVPADLQGIAPAADKNLGTFLGQEFFPNRFHADPSLQATELWMSMRIDRPQAAADKTAATPAEKANASQTQAVESKSNPQILQPRTVTAQIPLDIQSFHFAAPMPGGFVQPLQAVRAVSKKAERNNLPVEVLDVQGRTTPTPIEFSIGSSLSSEGYDRVVFREEPNFENKYIIELHDHGKDPIKMNHFYMALYDQNVGVLVDAARKAGVTLHLKLEHAADVNHEVISKPVYSEVTGEQLPLEVSVQLKQPLWTREWKMADSHWLESMGLPATYSPEMLLDAKLVLREDGTIWAQPKDSAELVPMPEGYYVRLPKHQIQNVVALLPYVEKGEMLNIVLSPTSNRVNIVARDASLTNVSLGKTMGSIVNGSLEIPESHAKSLMFSINYVLPGFASLLTPVLKKYGEKNLLALSLGMSVSSGVLATLGGFYGFVEHMTLGPVQKGLFVAAMLLMSGASILKQLVSNMLIRANRGEVVLTSTPKQTAKVSEEQTQEQARGFALITKRAKEFFTKKSDQSLRDIALYNLSFVYKNIGTLAFLSAPFLLEYGVKGLTGIDLGIDYSASFPLYAGYSAYVMWKILRSKLRDAYTAKNLLQSQQMVANMLKTGGKALANEPSKAIIDDVARSFKDSLDALAFAHVKLDPSKVKKELYNSTKELVLAQLEENLINQHHMSAAQAHELVDKVGVSIKTQENNLGNMWKMMKAPGVPALTSAMTLATVHEFVISSSFSGTMKGLISQGELANFLIAASLYVPFIVGRLGGNWISRRISKDSMYLLCSTLSAVGTGIMATAGASVGQTITGAAIASLGVGNFFTQMYDYIMTKYPKQNRELSSILALTMGIGGLGAIPAGYFAAQMGAGIPMDLLYAGTMLGASLLLTPGMLKNSSIVKGIADMIRIPWQKFKARVKRLFKRGGDEPPLAQNPA